MTRPVYETTVGAKVLFGWNGTELLPVFVDLDGQIVITSDDPTSKYQITHLDTTGDIKYFGYLDKNSNWYIRQLTASKGLYAKGSSNYLDNWDGNGKYIGTLTFDYFNNVF